LDVEQLEQTNIEEYEERTSEIINTLMSFEDVDDIFDYALNLTEQDKEVLYPYINSVLKEHRLEEFCFNTALESGYKEPKTYKMMMKRPNEEKGKWLEGVSKELNDFKK